ncbi:GntR family transcriptional regulator [Streptomyces sp. NPDC092296]|uniref:GntR family transcriptional regulator n=1 Tax=Streptomyces sp. NPDC092296 TaxID=3366012 RepID=UPI003801602C
MADPGRRPAVAVQERLRDQVARSLRAALAAGELRPGGVYSAPALAAEYGVSATPVREAMLDLAREGLVEPVRNKGFRITEPTDRDRAELAELRALLEVPIAGRLARAASRDQLAALRPLALAVVAAAEQGDAAGCLEADRRFHAALLGLTGNRHLVEVAGELRRRSGTAAEPGAGHCGELLAVAREHLELLDLMAAGDAAGAEHCMRRHLDREPVATAPRPPSGPRVPQPSGPRPARRPPR